MAAATVETSAAPNAERTLPPLLRFLLGLAVGVIAAMCGIGGGLFLVPLLHYGLRIPLRSAVGTSLLFIFPTAVSASVTEALRPEPAWDLGIVGVLVVGTLLGIQLGYRFSRWVPLRALKSFFAVALTVAALRMVLGAGSASGETAEAISTSARLGLAALIGVGGGFVAPILGIGGGLVMVPGLSLGVPGLGFAGARACSLLVACFSSARSSWLYKREGAMRPALGLGLGAGALVGAAIGVNLIHQPGWVDVARIVMATILGVVAVRFGIEALRGAPAPTGKPETERQDEAPRSAT